MIGEEERQVREWSQEDGTRGPAELGSGEPEDIES